MMLRELIKLWKWLVSDGGSSETEAAYLREAQIRHAYCQGIAGIRGSLAAAVIMTMALWDSVAHDRLLLWLACYATACAAGELVTWAFNRANPQGDAIFPWGNRFVRIAIIGGLLWGLTPILLFPTDSLFRQAILTFVLGGMSVGITTSHGGMREAYTPFILLVYLPLVCRFLYEGDDTHVTMAALLLIFMLYLVGSTGRMHRAVIESLKLRFEKSELIEVLTEEKEATEKLNKALRAEIGERKRAEAALRQSEARYRQIFEISPHAMAVHKNGTVLLANQAAARLVRASCPEALEGRSIWDFIPDDSVAWSRERSRIVEQSAQSTELTELKLRTVDNSEVDVEMASVVSTYKESQAVLTVARDVTETKRAQEKLRASLEEKEILLREIHHRVKNNLQIISSLLRLQSRFVGSKSIAEVLCDSENRLQSMALLHEKLYQSQDLASVDFKVYVGALLSHLLQSHSGVGKRVVLENRVEGIRFGLDTAIPCGLIINELASNCLKHAFPNAKTGAMAVSLAASGDAYQLVLRDDGVGLPQELDPSNPRALGLRLVNALVRQLNGQMTINRSSGAEYQIRFRELTPGREK
jgi:PAS domain S-box-containing protein